MEQNINRLVSVDSLRIIIPFIFGGMNRGVGTDNLIITQTSLIFHSDYIQMFIMCLSAKDGLYIRFKLQIKVTFKWKLMGNQEQLNDL